jgi:hypothetical protein
MRRYKPVGRVQSRHQSGPPMEASTTPKGRLEENRPGPLDGPPLRCRPEHFADCLSGAICPFRLLRVRYRPVRGPPGGGL